MGAGLSLPCFSCSVRSVLVLYLCVLFMVVQVSIKKQEVEEAMCKDISRLGDSFLIASCKWNQFVGDEECIVRLHEVIDWEAGGRTEAKHVRRIFSKEKEEGPRKVLGFHAGAGISSQLSREDGSNDSALHSSLPVQVFSIIQRGTKGCAFVDALESHLEYTDLPAYTTPEYKDTIYGECHASVLTLLRGTTNPKFQVMCCSKSGDVLSCLMWIYQAAMQNFPMHHFGMKHIDVADYPSHHKDC